MCEDCASTPVEVLKAAKKIGKHWFVICSVCGKEEKIDIEDYLIPEGTSVLLKSGECKTVSGYDDSIAKTAEEILYILNPGGIRYLSTDFQVEETWKKLRRTQYGLQRVCHHPKNEEWSNFPCYNCVERTKCNAELFDQLAAYEDTDLTPEQVAKYKAFGEKLIGWGVSLAEAEKLVEEMLHIGK